MLAALALSLLATAAPADTARGTIRGAVQSEGSGVPLVLAVVEVAAGPDTLMATTDSAGAYVLSRVPAGTRTLRVHQIGHVAMEMQVLVPAGGVVDLDLALRAQPIALPTVTARAGGAGGVADTTQAEGGEVAKAAQRVIDQGPGAAAAAPVPGSGKPGGDAGDPRDVLWVRGSAADLKLVLLDGAPVYTPFHMGGLIQTFEPEVLGSARLYLGGAPARYDGGLAYVMEMDTRAGRRERQRLAGSADLVSGRALAEGPLPFGASYLAGFRAVNGSALHAFGGGAEPFPYEYSEGLARFDVPTGGGSAAALTLFGNDEGVRVDTTGVGDDFARWGNLATSLRWSGTVGDGLRMETTAAYSDFRARLPWTTGTRSIVMLGRTRRLRVAADFTREHTRATLRYGFSFDRSWAGNELWTRLPTKVRLFDETNAGDVAGVYGDLQWQPASSVALRGGLRADLFGTGQIASVSPRISATWLLGPHAALTLAGGRYHQYVRVARTDPGASPVPATISDSLGLASRLEVARATHLSLGLDQELPRSLRLGLEGYFKRYERVTSPTDESYVSGVDVWVRRGGGAVSGWVGYSLTWAWALTDGETWGSGRFDGRQVVTTGVEGPLGRTGRFQVRVSYGSGLPYAAIPTAGGDQVAAPVPNELNSGGPAESPSLADTPRDPYLRVDAEVSRTWRPWLYGRRFELTPYVRVLNALDRRDALFYRYDGRSGDGFRSLASIPFLPIAGISFRT
jgi:hypothetical protein